MQQNKIVMWVVIGGALLVLIVSGVGYFLTQPKTLDLASETQRAQQNSPTEGVLNSPASKTYRNEAFGFELHYPDSFWFSDVYYGEDKNSPGEISGEPFQQEDGDRIPADESSYFFSFSTSSYHTLDELKANLVKQGHTASLGQIGTLPILTLNENKQSDIRVVYFIKNEFQYRIIENLLQEKTYTLENFISGMTFFTRHSQEEVATIITEQQKERYYRNEQWGVAFTYPSTYWVETKDQDPGVVDGSDKNYLDLYLINFLGHDRSDVHMEAHLLPKNFSTDQNSKLKKLYPYAVEEKVSGMTINTWNDEGGISYAYITKNNILFLLYDINTSVGTSRIKDLLSHMTFFTPKN